MPLPASFWLVIYTITGLLFGSFANVVIWRVPAGKSIVSPGSSCPACGHAVRWCDNVPLLSWVVLRARCRDCGSPISTRYPLVEALSGLLFLGAALSFGTGVRGVLASALFWALLVLAFIDLDTMRLPNAIVVPLGIAGFAIATLAQLTGFRLVPLIGLGAAGAFSSPLVVAVMGSLLGAGVSFGIAAAYSGVRGRSGFGMGDVKLLAALGPFLGPYTLLVLVLGSIAGAVVGVASIVRSGEGMSSAKIPFGPFLALGAVVVAVWGPAMWVWYASAVGLV